MLISIATESLVLWVWIRRIGWRRNFIRAAILYGVARAAELVMLVVFDSFSLPSWFHFSRQTAIPFVSLVLLCGQIIVIPVAFRLYRQLGMSRYLITAAVFTATLAGYLSVLGYLMFLRPLL